MAVGLQRCLGYQGQRCGVLVEHGNRCVEHKRALNRAEMAARRTVRPDLRVDERRRAETVAAWRAIYGDWCPGDPPSHPDHYCNATNPLTADHIHIVGAGGPERGELRVICHARNSARQPARQA